MKRLTNFLSLKFETRWFILLLFSALLLWLINLGTLPLRDWDEGYYGTVAKDMYQSNNWLYLTYYGEPFLLKPPLIIWLINLSYHIGGISEFTTRFPCALLTSLGVPLLYLLGKSLFSTHLPAILSAFVYLTLLPVVRHGRLAMIDGMINTYLIVAILCLVESRKNPIWAIGVGISLGLIALSKGILAIALGGILGVYILLDKPRKTLRNPALWLGVFIGFIPVLVWYLIQINYYGDLFIQVHFQQQNFDRLANAVEGNSGEIWYYGLELIKYSLPWLLFLPGSLTLAIQKWNQSWAKLFLTGFVLFFSIITLMGTKLPWYIMPIYPFLALGIAAYLSEFYESKKYYSQFLVIGMSILSFAVLFGGIYGFLEEQKIILLMITIIVFASLLLSTYKLKRKSSDFITILAIGLYTSLLLFVNSSFWIWELNEAFSVKPIAALIQNNTPQNTIIYTDFPYSRPSLDFYSDRQVLAKDQDNLKQLASTSSYLLLERHNIQNFHLSNAKILGEAKDFVLVLTQER